MEGAVAAAAAAHAGALFSNSFVLAEGRLLAVLLAALALLVVGVTKPRQRSRTLSPWIDSCGNGMPLIVVVMHERAFRLIRT